MAPAQKIDDLQCDEALSDAARSILTVRLDELETRRDLISGPQDVVPLHDLRIAAKRLRYSLEMFAVCFPPGEAQGQADRVREMQDILGRIHDLDVLHGLLVDRVAAIDEKARQQAIQIAVNPSLDNRRDEELAGMVRAEDNANGRLGLYKVIAAKGDERRDLYDQFEAKWSEWSQSGLLDSIRAMISNEAVSLLP